MMMTRTAVVAGATGGIGGACATRLRDLGFDLVVNARSEERLRAVAESVQARPVVGDCSDEDVATAIADAADSIDVIVHSVGVLNPKPVLAQSPEEFDQVLRTNLSSVHTLVRACRPKMGAGGRIILISSIAPKLALQGTGAYSAAKAGMNALAAVLSRELEPDGINVHVVSPGPVKTGMIEETVKPYAMLAADDLATTVPWLIDLTPHIQIREIDLRAAGKGPFAKRASV